MNEEFLKGPEVWAMRQAWTMQQATRLPPLHARMHF
jgi:hypothetical protein